MGWIAEQNLPYSSRPNGFRQPANRARTLSRLPRAILLTAIQRQRLQRGHEWRTVPHKLRLPIAPTPVLSWAGPVLSAVLLQMLSEQPPLFAEPFTVVARCYGWTLRVLCGAGTPEPAVRVNGRTVWQGRIWWDGKWRTLQGGVNVPTLVQCAQTPSTYLAPTTGTGTVGGMKIPLPNPTLSGNCIILTGSWATTTGITGLTPSDDKTNTYTLAKLMLGSAGFWGLASYYALNAIAGTRLVQFLIVGAKAPLVSAFVSEWYNVATSAAVDGTPSGTEDTTGGTSWTAGSLTTGTAGDLVYNAAVANTGIFTTATAMSSPAFTLLSANGDDTSSFEQYLVQGSAGAINATGTVDIAQGYVAIAFALKSAAAGTAPSAGGPPREIHHLCCNGRNQVLSNVKTWQFPSSGNLIVLTVSQGSDPTFTVTLSSSPGNTWTQISQSPFLWATGNAAAMLMWYAANATTSSTLTITMTWSSTPAQAFPMVVRDIANAAVSPFDASNAAKGTQTVVGNQPTFSITPAGTNELLVAFTEEGSPTAIGFAADGDGHQPLFDMCTWTNPDQDGNGVNGGAGANFQTDCGGGAFVTTDTLPVTIVAMYSPAGGVAAGDWVGIGAAFKAPAVAGGLVGMVDHPFANQSATKQPAVGGLF
jgi:hypothetical protein